MKTWVSRTLTGEEEKEDSNEGALAFFRSLPCGGVSGSGSGGHAAVTAPAA